MAIPPGAVYVSEDGLVTFDQYGRKLDSLGNVAWDDTQGAWGANAKPIERPQMQQQPQAQQAATPVVKAATGAYSPSVSATPSNASARPWADPMPPTTALRQPQSNMPQQQPMQRPNVPMGDPYRNSATWNQQPVMRPPTQQMPQAAPQFNLPMPNNQMFDPYSSVAGGYPDNVKAEQQRSAPRFDDGTQQLASWRKDWTLPQQPPSPVGPTSPQALPGPVAPGGREYWERGGRGPIQDGLDMMRFKQDEMMMQRMYPQPSAPSTPSGIIQGPMENPGLYAEPQQPVDPWSVAPGAPYIPPADTYDMEWRRKAFQLRQAMPALYGDATGLKSQLPGDQYNPDYLPPSQKEYIGDPNYNRYIVY